MSLLTAIYNFIKPELTDSPPDFTVTNENWDKLDTELKRQDDARTSHEAESANKAHGGFKGVLLKKTVSQSIASATNGIITWNAAEYDTSGFFNISNPTKITIPAGIKKVKLIANSAWDVNNAGSRAIAIVKNGGYPTGAPYVKINSIDRAQQNISSPVLNVIAGDYFELVAIQGSGVALNFYASNEVFLALEVIE